MRKLSRPFQFIFGVLAIVVGGVRTFIIGEIDVHARSFYNGVLTGNRAIIVGILLCIAGALMIFDSLRPDKKDRNMNGFKDVLMGLGVVSIVIGVAFSPFPYLLTKAKSDPSAASALIGTTDYFRMLTVMSIAMGLVLVLLSLLIKRKNDI